MGRLWAGLVSGVWVLVLFVALFGVVLNVPVVRAGGTIYIKADGSIDPPTAPISSVDNATYMFTDNVYDEIVVERNNIVIDGNGYALPGSGSGNGFYLSAVNDVTIKKANIKDFSTGIYITSSSYIIVYENNITNNDFAVLCDNVFGNKIFHNNFVNNTYQVTGWSEENTWDDDYPGGGNYWSDYAGVDLYSGQYQNELGSDGIGDTPYDIYADQDRYPLMSPWPSGPGLHELKVTLSGPTYLSPNTSALLETTVSNNGIYNEMDVSLFLFINNTLTNSTNIPLLEPGISYTKDYWWTPTIEGVYNVTAYATPVLGEILVRNNLESSFVFAHYPIILRVPHDYTTIQEAINAGNLVLPGDTILVAAGTYYENVVMNKSYWTLVGESPSTTFIDGGGTGSVVTVTVGNVKISNFTIQHATYGVTVDTMEKVVIEKNEISNNFESGIMIIGQSNVLVKNNTIKQNKNGIGTDASSTHSSIAIVNNSILSNQENGVYLYSYSSSYNPDYSYSYSYIYGINITDNAIYSNQGNGVYLYSYTFSTSYTQYSGSYSYSYIHDVSMTGNTISSNQWNGLYLHAYSYSSSSSSTTSLSNIYDVNITSNTISSNQDGICLCSEPSAYSEYAYSYSSIDHISVTSNTISSNRGNGVYLHSLSYTSYPEHDESYSYICDVNMTDNAIYSNRGNGVYLCSESGYSYSYSYIYDINITNNTISSNQGSGVCLQTYSYSAYFYNYTYIYDISVTSNTISSNQNGIYFLSEGGTAYSYFYSYIYDVNITSNTICSNKDIGIYNYAKNHTSGIEFDLLFTQNKVHSNSQGILIEGDIIANLTQNSIASNINEGILFDTSQNNEAHDNDIYGNGYGMKVSNGSTVDAERNYWGNSSGPYHESLNPDGKGNSVNGNGTDLDFIPFLTSPVDSTPPTTLHDCDDLWHATDFTITLTATDDMNGVAETYYIINNGATQNVTAYGQPPIIIESANNTLEYWSVDNVGNEENHHVLTGIKLDKTAPTIDIPSREPTGDVQPDQSVKVSVNVTDFISQVKNVTLYYSLNNGTTWEQPLPMALNPSTSLYEATIPRQQAGTWVKYKIIAYDQAGNNATLKETEPYCTYQVISESPQTLILPIFMATTLITVIIYKRKQQPP